MDQDEDINFRVRRGLEMILPFLKTKEMREAFLTALKRDATEPEYVLTVKIMKELCHD